MSDEYLGARRQADIELTRLSAQTELLNVHVREQLGAINSLLSKHSSEIYGDGDRRGIKTAIAGLEERDARRGKSEWAIWSVMVTSIGAYFMDKFK